EDAVAVGSDTSTVDRPAALPNRPTGDQPAGKIAPPAQPPAETCRRVGQSVVASALTEHLTDTALRATSDARDAAVELRRRRSRWARLTYRGADVAMLVAASVTAIVASPSPHSLANFAWGIGYALLTLLILEARGFYGFRL